MYYNTTNSEEQLLSVASSISHAWVNWFKEKSGVSFFMLFVYTAFSIFNKAMQNYY